MLGVAKSAELPVKASNVNVSTKGHGLALDIRLAVTTGKIAPEGNTARAPAKWAAGIVVDISSRS